MVMVSVACKKFVKSLLYYFQFILYGDIEHKIYSDTKWLRKSLRVFLFLNKISPRYVLQIHVYALGQIVREAVAKDNNFKKIKRLWLSYFEQSDDMMRMYLAKLFWITGIMDDEISKRIVKFAFETKIPEYRYWTTQDMSLLNFGLSEGFYPQFYTDRKKLFGMIAKDGNYVKLPMEKRMQHSGRKVLCLLAYHLVPTLSNSLVRVVKMIIDGIGDKYDDITLIATDSLYSSRDDIVISSLSGFSKIHSADQREDIERLFGDRVRIFYPSDLNYKKRWQEVLDEIYCINPDLIIDVTDEHSPLSYVYYQDYMTVYFPLRDCASSSYYDLITGTKWMYVEGNRRFNNSVDISKVVDWTFPEFVPIDKGKYTREQIGIDDGKYIILTIAKCSDVCSNEFIDGIVRLLERRNDFVWLIVGDTAPVYLHEKYRDLVNQCRVVERVYDNNLKGLCEICNVLLRTDSTGGSGGTAFAAMAGLPIVMTNYSCDCMRWLGKDYSHIDNYDDLFKEIERLYLDEDYYRDRQQLVKQLVVQVLNTQGTWDKLYEMISERKVVNGTYE